MNEQPTPNDVFAWTGVATLPVAHNNPGFVFFGYNSPFMQLSAEISDLKHATELSLFLSHYENISLYYGLHRTINRVADNYCDSGNEHEVGFAKAILAVQSIHHGVINASMIFHKLMHNTTENEVVLPFSDFLAWAFSECAFWVKNDFIANLNRKVGYHFASTEEIITTAENIYSFFEPTRAIFSGENNPYENIYTLSDVLKNS